LYPPSITAFSAAVQVLIAPVGDTPVNLVGMEKYLVDNTGVANDFTTENTGAAGGNITLQTWIKIDAQSNLIEWDTESDMAGTCNKQTVAAADLGTCTPWTAQGATFVQDCKMTDNQNNVENDHVVVAVQGGVITRMNITTTVNNQVVQTLSVVFTVNGNTPVPTDFALPAICANAAKKPFWHSHK